MARITVTLPDGKTEVINGAITFRRHKNEYTDGTTKIDNSGYLYTRTYLEGFVSLQSDRVKITGIDHRFISMTYKSGYYFLCYEFEEAEDMDIFNCIDNKKRDQIANEEWLCNYDDFQELRKINLTSEDK